LQSLTDDELRPVVLLAGWPWPFCGATLSRPSWGPDRAGGVRTPCADRRGPRGPDAGI